MIDLQRVSIVEARRSAGLVAHPRWQSLVAPLADRTRRAAQWCVEQQRSDGSWRQDPDPRPFETAVAGVALSLVDDPRAKAAAARARGWIESHSSIARDEDTRLFDEALGRLWLGESLDLRGPFWQSPVMLRKTWSLQVFALLLGASVDTGVDEPFLRALVSTFFAKRDQRALKPWHRVELAAMNALLSARVGDQTATREALADLRGAQCEDGSFCYLPVSTALALLALDLAPRDAAFERCLESVLRAQRADGSWVFTTNELWDTSILLRTFEDTSPFRESCAARARAFLVDNQCDDGGWGFRVGVQSDNDTASSALLALGRADTYARARARCAQYLAGQQMPSGLWRTWQDVSDEVSDDVLAHVALALSLCEETPPAVDLKPAREWLVDQCSHNSTWKGSWYRNQAYSVLEIAKALPTGHPVVARAMEALELGRNADGGWGSITGEPSVASATGLAVTAMLLFAPERVDSIVSGLGYLIESQGADGTWRGVAEMLGPRPLVSHYQTQTHAFAASGLALASRLAR
jgi:squalene-hopene/tetraprenyl-beta-curcumene cyclase